MKALSMMRSVACLAFAFGAIVVLQGCGDGGSAPPAPPPTTTMTTTTSTTTTSTLALHPAPWDPELKFPYCEEIDTFYRTFYDPDEGKEHALGQCKPSVNPGGFYTMPGEKGDDGKSDRIWSCWDKDYPKFERTNKDAQLQKFQGACIMKDWKGGVAPDLKEVPFCSTVMDHHPPICSPGPASFYGACWSSHTEDWLCIPQGDANIGGYAQGDCKSAVATHRMTGAPYPRMFYEGFCRFGVKTERTFKCDTVKSYDAGMATSCGQAVDASTDKACFSMISGVQWQCLQPEEDWGTPCEWAPQPGSHSGSEQFYKGRCVFKRNKNYESALDASNLSMADRVGHEMVV